MFIRGWLCYLITTCCAFQNTLSSQAVFRSVLSQPLSCRRRLGVRGCTMAAAARASHLPPGELGSGRVEEPGRWTTRRLGSASFAGSPRAEIGCRGPRFFLLQSHGAGLQLIKKLWMHSMGANKSCRIFSLGLFGVFFPTRWLNCCSLVTSQAWVCGQLTRATAD